MLVYGNLERAALDLLASDPSASVDKFLGRAWYNTGTNLAKYWDGTAIRTFVNTDLAQTLTNKILSGNTAVTLISGSGTLTLNTSGTATVPNATDTLVGKATTDTLTNKTFDAEGTGNSLTNIKDSNIKAAAAIAYSKLNLTGAILNADINASAAIAYSKLASLTDARVLVSSGGFVAASTVTTTTLGYLDATSSIQTQLDAKIAKTLTTTTGDIIYASSANTPARLGIGSENQVLKVTGGIPAWGTGGGGGTGINYLSSNPDAETNTTGWTTYADAAGAAPVDGTGGSPTFTWTRTTSSPLRGTGSFLATKDAANRQGEGVGFAFTIDSADKAKILAITFDYTIASGTYADGDLTCYIYDVTNAQIIQPAGYSILNGATGLPLKQVATFQTASNSTSYRLIVHTASTSASAYTVKFDNVSVGPQIVEYGAPLSDWTSFTPTGGMSTNTTYTGFWRRVGSDMEVIAKLAFAGAPTSTNLTINIPSGYTIDTSKLASTDGNFEVGYGTLRDESATSNFASSLIYSTTTAVLAVQHLENGTNVRHNTAITQASPVTIANTDQFNAYFKVPITGWSSNVLMSNDTDTRVVAAIISGDPASATSGNPIIVPTVVYDSHGGYSASTGRYTVPVPGVYKVYGALLSASSATTLTIYKNAVSTLLAGSLDSNGEATFAGSVVCVAGDLIDIRPGGTVDSTSMSLNIERLSGPSAIAATETVACSYRTNAGQVLEAAGGGEIVIYEDKDYDSHGSYNTSTGIFTAMVSGIYSIDAMMTFEDAAWTAGNFGELQIRKNSTATRSDYIEAEVTATTIYTMQVSTDVRLIAGDTIDVFVDHNRSGGNLAVHAEAQRNVLSIKRVGNY